MHKWSCLPPLDPIQNYSEVAVYDERDPFYTSTNPQIYAISAATIVSYMLVIILFITPRTFYVGGVGGGISLLGRKGTIGGSYGSNTVIGIGSRPWLQKIAALTLAISMTIVTADTFKWAERQYNAGYEDAVELSEKVIEGLEIRIVRLVSETFLWLAQAQTLIRLFQRHREKVVIQWTAFVLITLEIIFTILNNFVHEGHPHQPKAFASSIPALNYLFALALNICYAAFVIVYALRKRRLAFFHPQMHSMPLMALLSILSILIPVIFFILDLSKPDVSGWGSYVRWVGACAASVVVWEWVERIEALEREEKKAGILGREVFDGDEIYETNANSKRSWPRPSPERLGLGGGVGTGIEKNWIRLHRVVKRIGRSQTAETAQAKGTASSSISSSSPNQPGVHSTAAQQRRGTPTLSQPLAPPSTPSPFSRNDSASAASTVYTVVYHPATESTPPIPEQPSDSSQDQGRPNLRSRDEEQATMTKENRSFRRPVMLSRIPMPFRRQRQSPPAEVAAALAGHQVNTPAPERAMPSNILERLHLRKPQQPVHVPTGVIYVPAPPRRRPPSSGSGTEEHHAEVYDHDDAEDNESQADEDRPPAVVRNALRLSNPTSPVSENGRFSAENSGSLDQASRSTPPIEHAPQEYRQHSEQPGS
ncbi:uncharacterized protein KY384_004973 [Bacidia gigantensis]|uniref:uncharacterized protein n=1 Tax=Bacidia gigantensis TaxID=2732470 RepID=UPI001D03E72D|nr:uncharacterized protein KY384_004973 [Bacidia gigantensis]KAG8530470.1 hypothetical protein KY384_004973 [Bacidia gigantensis]